ncbi:MAG: hypothetical protein ACOY4U_11260 [Pseudomonadota bacterium]
MKTDHIRKDIFCWILALGLSVIAGVVGGYLFSFALYFFAHAPLDYSVILSIPVGSLFFLFTLCWFGVKIDAGIPPF